MKVVLSFVLLLAIGVTAALPQEKRGPSTAEERQRFVALAHKTEESPLDPSLQSERAWGIKWLTEVPDLTVTICTSPLGDFLKKKYKYSPEIIVQLTFSSGVFIIEHPEQAKDASAECLAGVDGALKAYQAILQVKPDAHNKALDDLLAKQTSGKLADHVRDTTSQSGKK